MKISIQLWSVRDHVTDSESFLALFPKLAALGFDGVEFAGWHGLPAETVRKALDDNGLVSTGAHVGLDDLRGAKLQETLDYCKALDMTSVGIGGASHSTPEETAASCAVLAAANEAARAQGITVYYHNHETEFMPFAQGGRPIDSFLAACPLELDAYWSFAAGVDNYAFIKGNARRVCHIHIKDGKGMTPVALGEGDCDLNAVVRAAKEIGLEWLVLENDDPVPDGLSDAARSMKWLKKNV